MTFFKSKRFLNLPRTNEDKVFQDEMDSYECPTPIFVIGLHRSGTTFLYQSMVNYLDLAGLTVYDLIYYDRLLKNHEKSNEQIDRDRLNTFFKNIGLATRLIDEVSLSDKTVEEYTFLFSHSRFKNAWKNDKFIAITEISKKLSLVNHGVRHVALKSPWAVSAVPELAARFKSAKFIFIKRDKKEIANSQFSFFLNLLDTSAPKYLSLLTGGNFRMRYQLLRPKLYSLFVGRNEVRRRMAAYTKKNTDNASMELENAINHVSPGSSYVLDYQTLIERPRTTIEEISNFLGIKIVGNLDNLNAKPRSTRFHPEIESVFA